MHKTCPKFEVLLTGAFIRGCRCSDAEAAALVVFVALAVGAVGALLHAPTSDMTKRLTSTSRLCAIVWPSMRTRGDKCSLFGLVYRELCSLARYCTICTGVRAFIRGKNESVSVQACHSSTLSHLKGLARNHAPAGFVCSNNGALAHSGLHSLTRLSSRLV